MFTKLKEAEKITHTLSVPSKMPGFSYNIPATRCIKGSALRNVEGSVCSKCYARKGRYVFPDTIAAMEKRFQSLNHPLWVEAITFLIGKKEKSGFFRWHDSGDIQDTKHLDNICEVAKRLPSIKFWLPTREYSMVSDYVEKEKKVFPDNLCVRLSALMLDGPAPDAIAARLGIQVSRVSSHGDQNCPAPLQGNNCGDCRACWQKDTYCVVYKRH